MFLSRLRLHPRDLYVLRDLGDAQQLHRTLMRAFPDSASCTPRRDLGVLYRVESAVRAPEIIIQALVAPDWHRLPDGYVLAHETKEIAATLAAVDAGTRLRFRLVANPSRKSGAHRPDESPPHNSRRVALATDEERHRWLAVRAERGGFRLDGADPFDGVAVRELAPAGRRGGGVFVRPVLFEGALQVLDAAQFRETVRAGIGPAKAYGCGLLSFAPLR